MDGRLGVPMLAIDALNVQVIYRLGSGYDVALTYRRNGGTFADQPRRRYDHLVTAEACQVVYDDMCHLMGYQLEGGF